MAEVLVANAFSRELLPAVQGFRCGEEEWETEVSDWIRGIGTDSVLEFVAIPACQIWLYTTAERGLIGFGSLIRTRWRYPSQADRAITLSTIPMLGIQFDLRGLPHGPGERHFSDQILDHLVYEAEQHQDRQPLLGLYVHPRNGPAIRFYRRSGFTDFDKTWTNPATGVVYPSMLLDLPVPRGEST